MSNLSATLRTGWTSEDWIMYWTQPANRVTLSTTRATTNTTRWTPSPAASRPGQDGVVEVDAPLGDVRLASGTQMGTVGGATDEGNPVVGLIVDTAAGSGSWTLGSPSCLG